MEVAEDTVASEDEDEDDGHCHVMDMFDQKVPSHAGVLEHFLTSTTLQVSVTVFASRGGRGGEPSDTEDGWRVKCVGITHGRIPWWLSRARRRPQLFRRIGSHGEVCREESKTTFKQELSGS